MTINRYETPDGDIWRDEDGPVVLYADHAAEVERLNARIKELETENATLRVRQVRKTVIECEKARNDALIECEKICIEVERQLLADRGAANRPAEVGAFYCKANIRARIKSAPAAGAESKGEKN